MTGAAMYKKEDGQISIAEFMSPFGKLDPQNRWVKMANAIPWDIYEVKYAEQFSKKTGAPATRFRKAMGALLIKRKTGVSDSATLASVIENPYMQHFIGLIEFTSEAPFSPSSMTKYRKYIPKKMVDEIYRKYCK